MSRSIVSAIVAVSIGLLPCGPGSGVLHHPRGHLLIRRPHYTRLAHAMQLVYTVFARNFDSGARDGYTDVDEGRRTETPDVTESSRVVDRGSCYEERGSPERYLQAGKQ